MARTLRDGVRPRHRGGGLVGASSRSRSRRSAQDRARRGDAPDAVAHRASTSGPPRSPTQRAGVQEPRRVRHMEREATPIRGSTSRPGSLRHGAHRRGGPGPRVARYVLPTASSVPACRRAARLRERRADCTRARARQRAGGASGGCARDRRRRARHRRALVVAADGARSLVREQAGIGAVHWDYARPRSSPRW